jgi:Ketosteroid isomerase-related protein
MEKQFIINHGLILTLLLGSTACTSQGQQADRSSIMDRTAMEEATTIVANQFVKWKNNEGSFFDILAEDVVWTVSGQSPVSGTYNGKAEFIEKAVKPILEKLKSPLQLELISLTNDGTHVWLHFSASATTISGGTYKNDYVWKLEVKDGKIIQATAFLDTYELTNLINNTAATMNKTIEETKEYIGVWVTEDGYIRHELLPNNRYDEARGNRKSAYQGSYKVTGNHIDYKDDTGFSADGEFRNGILYHAGMILYKEKN